MYSKRENPDQVPKFLTENFKKIIRAAKRIERLVVGISGGNWGILYAFPNIDVDFFKSTSISATNFERCRTRMTKGFSSFHLARFCHLFTRCESEIRT